MPTNGDVYYSANVSVSYDEHGGTAEIDVVESVGASTLEVDQSSLEVVSAEDAYIYSGDLSGHNTALGADVTVNSNLPLDDTYVFTQSTNPDQAYLSTQPLDSSQPGVLPQQYEYSHAMEPHHPIHGHQSAHGTESHQPMHGNHPAHATASHQPLHGNQPAHAVQPHQPMHGNQPPHGTESHLPMHHNQSGNAAQSQLSMQGNQPLHSAQAPFHPGSHPTSMHTEHSQASPQPANHGRIHDKPHAQVNAPLRPQPQVSNQSQVHRRPQQATRPQPRPNPQNPAYAQNGMNPGGTAYQDPQMLQNAGSPDSASSTVYGQQQEYSDAQIYSTPTEYNELSAVGIAEQLDNGLAQSNIDYSQLASDPDQSRDVYDDGSFVAGDGDSLSTALDGLDAFSFDDGGGEALNLLNAVGAISSTADLFTGDPTAAIEAAASSAIGAFSGDAVASVQNAASSVVNAFSGDAAVAAVQAGVGVAMSGVRIAASIGNWNEIRQKRKDSQAQFAAAHGASNPVVMSKVAIAAQLDEVLLVLSVLGQRLVVLDAINLAELPQAHAACRTACGQADSGDLLEHFDTLDGTLQYAVTAALFFCAACWPMHIYRGFGTGVLGNFLWGCPHPQYNIGQRAGFNSVDRIIAFLKSMPREVQLLTKLPHGLNRFTPSYDKNDKMERKKLMNAYRQFVREIEAKGHPQPRDGSFRIVSWHIPFATWNSPFTFKNSGHYWEDFLRWQMDPGRLLHAWTIGGHLDLNYGEMMWLPSGVAECLARWLVGFTGTTFKLVPSSALDYSILRLTPETRKIMLEDGFETVKAVRDPQAESRKPVMAQNIFVPAPPPVVRKSSVASPAQHGRPTHVAQAHGNQQMPAQSIAQRPMNQHPVSNQPGASHHAVTHATPQRMPSLTVGHPGVATHQSLQQNATSMGMANPGHGHSTSRGVPMGGFSVATISSASKMTAHPAHKMTLEQQNRIPVRKPTTSGSYHATTAGPAAMVSPQLSSNPLPQLVHSPAPAISRTSTISSRHSSSSFSSTAPSHQTFTTSTSNTTAPTSSSSLFQPAGIPAPLSSSPDPQAQYAVPPNNSQPPAPAPAPGPIKRRPVPRRPVQPVLRRVKAIENFEAEDDHELGFVVGDVMDVLKEMDDGWWEARLRGKVGAIPPDYVEVVEE